MSLRKILVVFGLAAMFLVTLVYIASLVTGPGLSHNLKTGPRISALNALANLGAEIALWRDSGSSNVPAQLHDLGLDAMARLGAKTNLFIYLGTNWKAVGIVALERLPELKAVHNDSFRGKIGVLFYDTSADALPTNRVALLLDSTNSGSLKQ